MTTAMPTSGVGSVTSSPLPSRHIGSTDETNAALCRPFGLAYLSENEPVGTVDRTGWRYDSFQQITVDAAGDPVFTIPQAGTVGTETTVQDSQEWPDKHPD